MSRPSAIAGIVGVAAAACVTFAARAASYDEAVAWLRDKCADHCRYSMQGSEFVFHTQSTVDPAGPCQLSIATKVVMMRLSDASEAGWWRDACVVPMKSVKLAELKTVPAASLHGAGAQISPPGATGLTWLTADELTCQHESRTQPARASQTRSGRLVFDSPELAERAKRAFGDIAVMCGATQRKEPY